MTGASCIAIDWGTTHRRIYVLGEDGGILSHSEDGRGVRACDQDCYTEEFASLRKRWGNLPIIAAGMIGSSIGWREVPYCPLPATLDDLADRCVDAGDRIVLVPGVATAPGAPPDVMRGEETQILGALAPKGEQEEKLFCLPGTHNKWARAQGRAIVHFSTAMTGELFALLRDHSILSGQLGGPVTPGSAFLRGVERGAGAADLTTALFQIRAARLLGRSEQVQSAAYLSGLLIGADVAAQGNLAGRTIRLICADHLAALYEAAIDMLGAQSVRLDPAQTFVDGIVAIREAIEWMN